MEEQAKKSVLFLGIHNATRSQMAEGLLKHFRGDKFEAFSAGVEPAEDIDTMAAEVMKEIGIEVAHNNTKSPDFFSGKQFDFVVTICSSSSEPRPEYPNAVNQLSWDIVDPYQFKGTDMEKLDEYRKTRDAILQKIRDDLLAGM